MDAGLVTVGAVGTGVALVLLYYTTGVLLHFVTFDADTVPRYMKRLRMENSFEILLITILLHALGMLAAGATLFLQSAVTPTVLAFSFIVLFAGMLYFLHRMHVVTAI